MKRWIGALLFVLAGLAAAQQDGPPNAILLIAKPALLDPNFRQTVVLVTQAADFSTIGVILNRPSERPARKNRRAGIMPADRSCQQVTVALFRCCHAARRSRVSLLKDVYLSMHPENIAGAAGRTPERAYRLYQGFSGWAPRQLESEIERDGWYVLPATEEVVFREEYGQACGANSWRKRSGKNTACTALGARVYFCV